MMNSRENMIRAMRFDHPEYIPVRAGISGACYDFYETAALEDLMASHQFLFPGYKPSGESRKATGFATHSVEPFTDTWGVVWQSAQNGLEGSVIKHPFASWDALDSFIPPDATKKTFWGDIDWDAAEKGTKAAKEAGNLTAGSLHHGHTFMYLMYLRGYEDLMMDMMNEEPRLWKLIEMLEEFNAEYVRRYVGMGVDFMGYPEDLGMQFGPMVPPELFKKYIKPSYTRLMAPARAAGIPVHMHSDGDLHTLIDHLIEGGVEVMNLQDLCNGIDWIRDRLKGKICIDLDVDRQNITFGGTPAEIDALIRREVETLGSKEGGLMMMYGMYPQTPLKNADAVFTALEKYAGYWAG